MDLRPADLPKDAIHAVIGEAKVALDAVAKLVAEADNAGDNVLTLIEAQADAALKNVTDLLRLTQVEK